MHFEQISHISVQNVYISVLLQKHIFSLQFVLFTFYRKSLETIFWFTTYGCYFFLFNTLFSNVRNEKSSKNPRLCPKNKPLTKAPKRFKNMLLKTQDYNIKMTYKPGTKIAVSDAISRI